MELSSKFPRCIVIPCHISGSFCLEPDDSDFWKYELTSGSYVEDFLHIYLDREEQY